MSWPLLCSQINMCVIISAIFGAGHILCAPNSANLAALEFLNDGLVLGGCGCHYLGSDEFHKEKMQYYFAIEFWLIPPLTVYVANAIDCRHDFGLCYWLSTSFKDLFTFGKCSTSTAHILHTRECDVCIRKLLWSSFDVWAKLAEVRVRVGLECVHLH